MSKEKQLIDRAIIFLLLSSLTLLCALFVDKENSVVRVLTYVGGLLFWGLLILGYVMFYRFCKLCKKQQKNNRSVKRNKKPGIMVFFSNPAARKADIVMILSLFASIVLVCIKQGVKGSNPAFNSFLFEFISVFSFAVFILAAQLHAILNGVNYRYYLSVTELKDRNQPTKDRAKRERSKHAASEDDDEPKRSEKEQTEVQIESGSKRRVE